MRALGRHLVAVGALGLTLVDVSLARSGRQIAPFDYRFDAAAAAFGVSAAVLRAIAETESRFRCDVVNPLSGATGLMQFLPETARRYGVDPWNPTSSIFGAAEYLRDLVVEYRGDLTTAINVYGGDLTRQEYAARVLRRVRRYDGSADHSRGRCLTGRDPFHGMPPDADRPAVLGHP